MADFSKKRTMIKDRVGCVKTSSYNLPVGNHVYGKPSNPDPENAGDVISNWVTAKSTAVEKEPPRSYVHANIVAIKHGCVTAKSQKKFLENHSNIRMKEMLDDTGKGVNQYEGPFGIRTKYAAEPISDVLSASFTNFNSDDADYPTLDGLVKKGALPLPRPTKSSELLSRSRNDLVGVKPSDTKMFKMKRFENISSRIDSGLTQQATSYQGQEDPYSFQKTIASNQEEEY